MSPVPLTIPAELVELLDDAALSVHELARGCAMSPGWVCTRVEAGVLQPAQGGGAAEWRFASATLTRARRIAQLEHTYDADPQLAALAADLMEEVAELRRRLAFERG
ncbi:chaperone modulator CbpM [Ottowia testudinis]|uniref:MerR family transcriptional regulator n=1 Tax=Ottowia testudinis TaxID=2816950 RepID=A0A975CFY1_9BURK|nr:chaperone modulator CbpM [Ottowia testudinis]QTD45680.1 MerR family transcriptional regulator [Ottowia testudinis]